MECGLLALVTGGSCWRLPWAMDMHLSSLALLAVMVVSSHELLLRRLRQDAISLSVSPWTHALILSPIMLFFEVEWGVERASRGPSEAPRMEYSASQQHSVLDVPRPQSGAQRHVTYF